MRDRIKLIERDGWRHGRIRGSHRQYNTPGRRGVSRFRLSCGRGDTPPDEKIVLRYTNAIQEKHRKCLQYLRDGRIIHDDAFVIAINAAPLSSWPRAANDVPRFLKALYPLGHYQVLRDRRTRRIIGNGNEPRFQIVKASGKEVLVDGFMQKQWEAISGVLCSSATPASHGAPLGFDFEIALNPMGRCLLPVGAIPAMRSWSAELSDSGAKLVGQAHTTL